MLLIFFRSRTRPSQCTSRAISSSRPVPMKWNNLSIVPKTRATWNSVRALARCWSSASLPTVSENTTAGNISGCLLVVNVVIETNFNMTWMNGNLLTHTNSIKIFNNFVGYPYWCNAWSYLQGVLAVHFMIRRLLELWTKRQIFAQLIINVMSLGLFFYMLWRFKISLESLYKWQ